MQSSHTKKVALILAGCGRADGSVIQETMACIFALSKRNIAFDGFSFNQNQHHVINHNTGEEIKESRNMLNESSRITRKITKDLKEINVKDYAGVVFPGGFGVAKNYSDFAFKGKDFSVNEVLFKTIREFNSNNLPIASCCISPLILSYILGKKHGGPGIKLTTGDNENEIDWPYQGTIEIARDLGNDVIPTSKKVVIDEKNKVITSPAYMKATSSPYEVYEGIDLMIEEFSKMI